MNMYANQSFTSQVSTNVIQNTMYHVVNTNLNIYKTFNHMEQALASRTVMSEIFNADFLIMETYTL